MHINNKLALNKTYVVQGKGLNIYTFIFFLCGMCANILCLWHTCQCFVSYVQIFVFVSYVTIISVYGITANIFCLWLSMCQSMFWAETEVKSFFFSFPKIPMELCYSLAQVVYFVTLLCV